MNSKGVYLIRNNVNQKIYTGSTNESFRVRWNNHKSMLWHNKHPNRYLQNSWNKHGKENFVFLILKNMPDATPKEIIGAEQWYLDNAKTHTHNSGGYNMALCAEVSSRGIPLSKEHKKKIGDASRGKILSEETKRKIGAANSGRHVSVATKQKMARAHKGRLAGEKHHGAKLQEADVLEIRRLYLTGKFTQELLGKMFLVVRANIGVIVTRKTWNHI